MGKLLKFVAWIVGTVIVLFVVVAVAVTLFFDPNDYKADIEQGVRDATGREFTIDGDLSLSVFPWIAVDMGRTTLGNAEGFGEEPFLRFDSARLSVKLLPLVFSREIAVGTASLEGLRVNLAVDADGRSNWDDLAERQEQADQLSADEPDGGPTVEATATLGVEVESVSVRDAAFSYVDEQAGSRYTVTEANLESGRITGNEPVPVNGGFAFALEPDAISGRVDLAMVLTADFEAGIMRLDDLALDARVEGATEAPADIRFAAPAITLDTSAQTADIGELELAVFDLELNADVEPFAYADSVEPKATLSVAAFSPRSLMQTLGSELPAMADPAALELLRLDARAVVGSAAIALEDIVLVMDDTTLSGRLSVPRARDGAFELDLAGDSIDLNRYMAPADETEAVPDDEAPPAEIPAELLRAVNARGNLTFDSATMGAILFEDIELGLNLADGRLRLHPITSRLFDGRYQGDVRVDASGPTPVLSVNERLEDVSLAPLGRAMFERDNLTGKINGVFVLSGRGDDMAAVQQTLNGNLSFELKDGTLEGRDVWYELRRARALIRRETPPEPELPARTRFSNVSATGTVVDGVLNNEDFQAELPFLRLTGAGTVNLVETTLDYTLRGRVLEQPELMGDVTPAELDDFTKAVVPIRITGTLTEPDFGLDLAEAARERVEEEVRGRLLDLLGGDEEADSDPEAATDEEEEQDPEDVVKDRLRDLLRRN